MVRPEAGTFVHNVTDSVAATWLFRNSALILLIFTFSYLYFILEWGPRHMRNRPAYKLNTFIRYYNIFQIVTNAFCVYTGVRCGWVIDNLIFTRTASNPDLKVNIVELIYAGWILVGLKFVDFIETCIFVLRKKQNQVSFLHVYHHLSTSWLCWLYLRFFMYEIAVTLAILNCSVHVIMYTYYLLSSYGPTMAKLVSPIKPYITTIQMVQFVFMIAYMIQAALVDNHIVRNIGLLTLLNVVVNFYLFYDFYKKSYKKANK